MAADDRAIDAVEAAGGLTADAAPEGANLAAPVVDGDMIYVPTVEELRLGTDRRPDLGRMSSTGTVRARQ